jgi:hypothetical protein
VCVRVVIRGCCFCKQSQRVVLGGASHQKMKCGCAMSLSQHTCTLLPAHFVSPLESQGGCRSGNTGYQIGF